MEEMLRPHQVAQRLATTVDALHRMRRDGLGPSYLRLGARTVVYDPADLAAWIDAQKAATDAEAQAVREQRATALQMWAGVRVEFDKGAEERAGDLYRDYAATALAAQVQPLSITAFGRALSQYGLRKRRSDGIVWEGLRLRAADERRAA